jgi:hypothetical protein
MLAPTSTYVASNRKHENTLPRTVGIQGSVSSSQCHQYGYSARQCNTGEQVKHKCGNGSIFGVCVCHQNNARTPPMTLFSVP